VDLQKKSELALWKHTLKLCAPHVQLSIHFSWCSCWRNQMATRAKWLTNWNWFCTFVAHALLCIKPQDEPGRCGHLACSSWQNWSRWKLCVEQLNHWALQRDWKQEVMCYLWHCCHVVMFFEDVVTFWWTHGGASVCQCLCRSPAKPWTVGRRATTLTFVQKWTSRPPPV